jgi:UDP-N-acetylmuramate dehydrogenase
MFENDVPLAEHTTLGLGGRATRFARCRRVEQIRECLGVAGRQGWAVQVLGGGSNIIFPDAGFPGLVLKIELAGVDWQRDGAWATVTAGAGETWDELVGWCVDHHLAGVECLSGIPGLVGATPIQNVGAYGQEICETLVSLQALDRESLESVEFSASECAFGYRRSRFKAEDRDRYIITQVTYRLQRRGRPAIRYPELDRYLAEHVAPDDLERGQPSLAAVRSAVLALRRRKSMLLDPSDPNARSVGSFFLNPVVTPGEFARLQARWPQMPSFPAPSGIKIPAAWLVEQAGFPKGYRHKGAGISSKHALALINCGGTTHDLLELAGMIQGRVAEIFGLHLEREPVVVQLNQA